MLRPKIRTTLWERIGRNIGQMMWLTTRTRPDISACLGNLAAPMVRRPKQVKIHLIDWWRYFWTTKDLAMCTLPSPKTSLSIRRDEPDLTCSTQTIKYRFYSTALLSERSITLGLDLQEVRISPNRALRCTLGIAFDLMAVKKAGLSRPFPPLKRSCGPF